MCFLLAASIYGMRRAHYEIFLITHIGLSIAALISIYYHVAIFPAGEWNIFIWPCAAIWIFDRIIRGLRTLAFDWKFWDTRATITYNSASHLVRVEVPMERCRVSPRPGTYYYMHVLDDLRYAAQSHPFTLAYVSPPVDDDANVPISPISLYRPSSPAHSISETSSLLSHHSTPTSPSMVFLVRPYSGFTSRLATSCATEPARLRVLLAGPDGCTLPLHTYGTVLFIAGGTGIAVALSHLRALLAAGSRTHSVRITWAVREAGFLAAVLREFKGEIADERCVLDVHVTQDSESGEAEEHKGVTVRCGRPDVKGVVERVVDESSERTAVVACGPAVMADQARRACVGVLGVGRDVDYFEESFKW
jgi:NAD(P)H-flavin reductase